MHTTSGIHKILMTADTVGGGWTYSIELVHSLAAYGIKVALAAMGAPISPRQRREAGALHNCTLYERNCKLEWMEDPWEDVDSAGEWLCGIEAEYKPDCIHCNNYAHGALPWQAPVVVAGHACVYSWHEAVKGEMPDRKWNEYHMRVSMGLSGAYRVTASSDAMLKALRRHYGPFFSAGPIHNGRRKIARRRPKEPFIFAAGGIWDEAKNVGVLQQAAPALSWPIFVAGNNRHPDATVMHAPQFEGLHLLGELDKWEMGDWLGRASIYAFPALYEPFGFSILDAAQACCALIIGDIPSLRELWDGAALFVSPHSPDAFREAIAALIESPDLRRTLSQRAVKRARQYSPERMGGRYVSLYQACVAHEPVEFVRDV